MNSIEKYNEFGTNYRFFLGWRYAIVLGAGAVDFAVFKFITSSNLTDCQINILVIISILLLILLMLFELRTVEIYRELILNASNLERGQNVFGYYSMMFDGFKRRKFKDFIKGFTDLYKFTHTGAILWFMILSIAFICIIAYIPHSPVLDEKKSNISENSIDSVKLQLNIIENKIDSLLNIRLKLSNANHFQMIYDSLKPNLK